VRLRNAGRLISAKRALKPRQVWAIRFRLGREHRLRDRAIFDLAIDSKLRGGDVVAPAEPAIADADVTLFGDWRTYRRARTASSLPASLQVGQRRCNPVGEAIHRLRHCRGDSGVIPAVGIDGETGIV
jgi:hypothetical protein